MWHNGYVDAGYALDPSVNDGAADERLVGDTGTAEELKGKNASFTVLGFFSVVRPSCTWKVKIPALSSEIENVRA